MTGSQDLARQEEAVEQELKRLRAARYDAAHAERQQRVAEQLEAHRRLRASIKDEVAEAVLDMHSPDQWLTCNGDHNGEVSETWPCRTYMLVAKLLGATFERNPDDGHLALRVGDTPLPT